MAIRAAIQVNIRASCTPSSVQLATMAYVLAPMTNVATPRGPSSSSKPSTPSVALPTATGADGSLTSMSCTPSSALPKTMAYVLVPMTNVATLTAPSSSSNPSPPSVRRARENHPSGQQT